MRGWPASARAARAPACSPIPVLCTKTGYRAGIPWICAQTRTLACRERRPARADHLEVEPHAAGLMAVDKGRDAVGAWRGGRERERRGATRLEVGRRP